MVPEGWAKMRFEEVGGGVKNAIVDGPFGSNLKSAHYRDKGIPVFQSGFVTDGTFKPTKYVFVDEGLFAQQYRSAARGGDILMAKIGAQAGRCAVIPDDHDEGILAGNSLKITPNPDSHDRDFILHWLTYHYNRTGLSEIKSTTAQPAISIKNLKRLWFLSPPLPEQRKIAEILSTWDAAIEKTEALLATAKAQKRALMQSLLTGKRRFPEFEGQEWKEVRLGDVATIAMGSSPKSSAYNNEGVGLPLIQGNADVKNGRSAPRTFTSEITTRCSPGDILFSVRAPVGSVAISDHNACVGRGAAVIRPTTEHDWFWLKHLMLWLEPQWARVSQGSTFEAVNSKDLKTFTVPMPSTKAEEAQIGRVVEAAHLECSTLMAQIAKLRAEKKALMQQLLTGKRRVKA